MGAAKNEKGMAFAMPFSFLRGRWNQAKKKRGVPRKQKGAPRFQLRWQSGMRSSELGEKIGKAAADGREIAYQTGRFIVYLFLIVG